MKNGFAGRLLLCVGCLVLFLSSGCGTLRVDTTLSNLEDIPGVVGEAGAALYVDGYVQPNIDYNDPLLKQRTIFLTQDLDDKQVHEAMCKLKYLDQQAPGEQIDLFINTNGGDSGDALANFMRTLKSRVNTYALDYCASAGAVVLAAGTGKRSAFRTSRILIHIEYPEVQETEDPDFTEHDVTKYVTELFWREHSSLPTNMYYGVTGEKWLSLNAEQALKYGVVDEIVDRQTGHN